MSYDLLVFAPAAAPRERAAFLAWYEQQTTWDEEHACPAALQGWYAAMTQHFPNMNDLTDEELDKDEDSEVSRATEYSFGPHVCHLSFAGSVADEALQVTRKLTQQHGLGFFDVSSADGEILFPETGNS